MCSAQRTGEKELKYLLARKGDLGNSRPRKAEEPLLLTLVLVRSHCPCALPLTAFFRGAGHQGALGVQVQDCEAPSGEKAKGTQ